MTSLRVGGLALAAVTLLSACASDDATTGGAGSPEAGSPEAGSPEAGSSDAATSATDAAAGAAAPAAATSYPAVGGHVHGLARDPADGTLYVGTHEGLFSYAGGEPELVSPVMDFMGFAVAGPGEFVASGHAGPGGEFPEPMGLIRSEDAGRTWAEVSRGGESDFHSLTASDTTTFGYDGALRRTDDGTSWGEATLPEPIADVALSPGGQVVLITTESGLQRSQDDGDSWEVVPNVPLMIYVEWADDDTVVGLGVDGQIMVSQDGGASFEARGEAPAADVVAFSASREGDRLEALLATQDEVLVVPL